MTDQGTLHLAVYMNNVYCRFPAGRRDLLDEHFTIPYGKRHNIKDLGAPKMVLGIEITRDIAAGTLKLSQGAYIIRSTRSTALGA